ncbi:unnamed protein product [Rhizoctonia solani]|uniref:Uncharacterized protein n=1 Tax=Rhizoctonia solani TaxID=456999 RepID=A0A8H3A4K4_9AGAM|nr:unnamed protein product [Rhizoctonia solani]
MVPVENGQQQTVSHLTITYDATGKGTALHSVVVPRTDSYIVALNSTKEALRWRFADGSSNKRCWLAIQVETQTGILWAEIHPEAFPVIVEKGQVEFRLCEDRQNVNLLPIENDMGSIYKFKLITIGAMSVGKSMTATTGVRSDVSTRFVTTQAARLKVELWDTAGQERFRSVVAQHYRGTHEIRAQVDDSVPIMLIGNQIDLAASRTVNTDEGEKFARNEGLMFAETSAKTGTGVDDMFQTLVDG